MSNGRNGSSYLSVLEAREYDLYRCNKNDQRSGHSLEPDLCSYGKFLHHQVVNLDGIHAYWL